MTQSDQDLLTTCLNAAQVSMLSVGSGDCSQQLAIVQSGHTNLLVTCYDSETQLVRKYPHAKPTLEYLKSHCQHPPVFQVDATSLHTYDFGSSSQNERQAACKTNSKRPKRKRVLFDLIFFTFPHTGIPTSNVDENIASNRQLLKQFLQSAQHILKENGEIQITLKRGDHYEKWNVPSLVKKLDCCSGGLKHISTHSLDKSLFPGYIHRLTKGMNGHMKEVIDKKGATVHVFGRGSTKDRSSNGANSQTNSSVPTLTVGKVTIVDFHANAGVAWSDEEIWAQIMEITTAVPKQVRPLNVLDIRRQCPQPVPDTRAMNRVLYLMEKKGFVQRHKPRSGKMSQKPLWTLVEY